MRQRRIGTITLGVSLVLFGILFMIRIFGGVLNYTLIFHLWPLILVALGMEILYYSCLVPEKAGAYDFAAIIILIMIVFFAMCMAGFDMVLTNMPKDIWDKWW